jgi:tripartite-type tricarboxylate transporter receptor subunit TctC
MDVAAVLPSSPFNRRPFAPAVRRVALGLALAATAASGALAQEAFPTRPVTLVVGFPAGGGTDIMARQLARYLEQDWQTPVVVENRPGAGGIVAAEQVLRAQADGHVLMMAHIQTVVLAPLSMANADRAAITNFAPISLLARQPHVVAVRHDSPLDSIDALLRQARANSADRPLTYGSTGVGGVQHLAAARFAADAGVTLLHVPYQGSTPALQGLIAGEIDVFFDGITPASPFLKSGDIRALAVTVPESIAGVDAPPLAEHGFPGYDMTSWWAVVAPPGITDGRRQFLAEAVQRALDEPEFQAYLDSLGVMSGKGITGDRFDSFVSGEVSRYAALAESLGIKP